MTIDEIGERLRAISNASGDSETAHDLEDRLHSDVLWAIGSGELTGSEAQAAAILAWGSKHIDFSRWHA